MFAIAATCVSYNMVCSYKYEPGERCAPIESFVRATTTFIHMLAVYGGYFQDKTAAQQKKVESEENSLRHSSYCSGIIAMNSKWLLL